MELPLLKTRNPLSILKSLILAASFYGITADLSAQAVTGVSISPDSMEMVEGQYTQLTPAISPANAANQNVTWSSSNTNVVTVSTSGNVTAIYSGNATVTVTTQDGGFSDQILITVEEVSNGWTLVWKDDFEGVDWHDGDGDGVKEWMNYNEDTDNASWAIISKTQAATEGVDISQVAGNKLYKGWITGTSTSNHRAYPIVGFASQGSGRQPGFPNGVPSPMINQWHVWWDPQGINLTGKWMHLATWSNNDNWIVHTFNVVHGGVALPYILDINAGDKVRNVRYYNNRVVPTAQWMRITVYIDYSHNLGSGVETDGILAVWINGDLVATGSGAHLDPDGTLAHGQAEGTTNLRLAHWGTYAHPSVDRGIWYEDVNRVWTLDNPITDFSVEPQVPGNEIIPVTGVSLSPSDLNLPVNVTQQFSPSISPFNASNRGVTWNSSNENVATVNDSGLVTVIRPGTTTITVTTDDGGFTASSVITVDAEEYPYDIELVSSSQLGSYPERTLDGEWGAGAGWETDIVGASLMFELTGVKTLSSVDIVFKPQSARSYIFKIESSLNGSAWTTHFNGQSVPIMELDWESYPVPNVDAKFVRITGYGNTASTSSTWSVLREVRLNYSGGEVTSFVDLVEAQPDGSEDDLFQSSWFGSFYFQENWNGWIMHEDLQWLYVGHVSNLSSMWLWSQDLSAWIYTNSSAFPWTWAAREE